MASGLEAVVELALHEFPDRITVGLDDHAAFHDFGGLGHVALKDHVLIPSGEILAALRYGRFGHSFKVTMTRHPNSGARALYNRSDDRITRRKRHAPSKDNFRFLWFTVDCVQRRSPGANAVHCQGALDGGPKEGRSRIDGEQARSDGRDGSVHHYASQPGADGPRATIGRVPAIRDLFGAAAE